MSRKTSFEEAQELPTNCGVDIEGTCAEWDGTFQGILPDDHVEELGECEEEDEECLLRKFTAKDEGQYDKTSTNLAVRGSTSSKKNSLRSTQKSFLTGFEKNGHLGNETDPADKFKNRMFPEMENDQFEGLPGNYYKKNYRPDYPADLRMKQVCASKPVRRRTVGTTKTQIQAFFTPSDSAFLKQGQDDRSVAGTSKKRGTGGGASSFRTSFTKGETVGVSNLPYNETSPLEQNRMPPPIVSSSDEVIVDWLEDHNIQMMFEYFLGLCVIHQPPDPWSFISELAGKIREARNNIQTFDNLPRILTPEHTEAIFRIYDRIENGFITMSQYKSAMEAMGLSRFSMNPDGWEEDAISKDTFVKESTEAISDLLRSFMVFNDTNPDVGLTDKRTSGEQSGTRESGSRSASYSSSTGEYTGSSEMKSREGTGSDTEFPRNAEDAPLNLNLTM